MKILFERMTHFIFNTIFENILLILLIKVQTANSYWLVQCLSHLVLFNLIQSLIISSGFDLNMSIQNCPAFPTYSFLLIILSSSG